MSWEMVMVVGLEVHVQLATKTKLFCSCSTESFGKTANTYVCPVCTGQPGVLPVLNKTAVELGFMAAMAVGCKIKDRSIFARKNYFYPDLPRGYQISQYDQPFSEKGYLVIPGPPEKRIGITRIHMEDDAGKSLHAIGAEELSYSLVDFNRAGVPLIEIVSEPDMRTPDEAYQYLTTLKTVMQYCGVSRCDMEKGELRCDANISIRGSEGDPFGTKVEIKNLNSFKAVREALLYEFARQKAAVVDGEEIRQETRLWDAEAGRTESMRSKEEAHDYRYFPEPDLVPLVAEAKWVSEVHGRLPELPSVRKKRFATDFQLSDYDAGVLTADRHVADYFEETLKLCGEASPKIVANWVTSDLLGRLNGENKSVSESNISPANLGGLIGLIEKGTINIKIAKDVFGKMWDSGHDAAKIVKESGLEQVQDSGQISSWVDEAIKENPKAVEEFRGGKEKAIGAIVGAVMKKSKGKANPGVVNKLIKEKVA